MEGGAGWDGTNTLIQQLPPSPSLRVPSPPRPPPSLLSSPLSPSSSPRNIPQHRRTLSCAQTAPPHVHPEHDDINYCKFEKAAIHLNNTNYWKEDEK